MTTGGIVPKKKRSKIKIPANIAGLFQDAPEIYDILGEGYKWGFETPQGLAPELSPQSVFDYWREADPYGLYMLQLKDYLYSLITEEDGEMVIGESWEQMGDPLSSKRIKEAQNIMERAKAYIEFGVPVQALPYYEDVSQSLGPNFEKAYTQHVEEEMEIGMEIGEEEKLRKQLLSPYATQSAGNRQKLLEAVQEGLITQEEAYGGTKGKQKPYPWAPNTEDLDKAAFEMQQAGVSPDEIRRWLTEIAPQIKAGNIEQEMDTRSPWLKWQHAMADEENARNLAQMGKQTIAKYQPFLRELAQYGIPITDTALSAIEMSEMGGGYGDPAHGQTVNLLQERLAEAKRQEQIGKGTWYSQMAPELFEEYRKATPTPNTGTPTGFFEFGFPTWLEQEPNKQKKLDFETKMFKDYGDILPEYQNYLERNRFQGVKPINAWIQENPEISTYWRKRQAQRMRSLA